MFIDESGVEDNACPEYDWSLKGTRAYGLKEFQAKRRISMLAALNHENLKAPMIFEGTCNRSVFKEWVLVPTLKPGQIVIMDNISFHKSQEIRQLIESAGAEILFLPTYSPDLNKIEFYWAKLKKYIRNINHQFMNFEDAVIFSFNNVLFL